MNKVAKGRRASRDLFQASQMQKKKETTNALEQIIEEQTARVDVLEREEKQEEEIEVDIHHLHIDAPPSIAKTDIFN